MSEKIKVPVENWGKDHYSTLLYIETRVVDYRGIIDTRHMRRSSAGHPTRLRDGSVTDASHDDFSIIEEFEDEGLVEREAGVLSLTTKGWAVAGAVRRARAEGDRMPVIQVNAMHSALANFS